MTRLSIRLLVAAAALVTVTGAAGAQTIGSDEYASRRAALVARLPDNAALVALGAPEPTEDFLSFFQSSPFMYLTGFREPEAALVVTKKGGRVASTLFVAPRSAQAEVWTGARVGVDGVRAATGLPGRVNSDFDKVLDSLAAAGTALHFVGHLGNPEGEFRTRDRQRFDALKRKYPSLAISDFTGTVDQARGKKTAAELALIRKAVDITVLAHREAARALEAGMNEFELQALIEYTFRRQGADRPGFATIVGSGPNSTTLHYNRDDRFIQPGELVVMDIGASARGYTADVTRTYPANGTFTPAQREIYQIVRDAQRAAETRANPGTPWRVVDSAATATIATGLARVGLIESPTATYDCTAQGRQMQCPQYTLYYMHGLGHGIGLDVHDPEQFYFTQTIAEGSAFTIEPGIYVRANTLEIIEDTPRNRALEDRIRAAVARYSNTGVRIEDDYIVTARGTEWISRAPREIDEVEALMREPFTGPVARDSKLVDWYR